MVIPSPKALAAEVTMIRAAMTGKKMPTKTKKVPSENGGTSYEEGTIKIYPRRNRSHAIKAINCFR